jgi:hypothetical protein
MGNISPGTTQFNLRAYDPVHAEANLYSHYAERMENDNQDIYESDDPNERHGARSED